MKAFYASMFVLLISLSGFAQSQRIVLVEEFTGEDCGPCAAINPTFNAMLTANAAKAIPIKYQSIVSANSANVLYNQTKTEMNVRDGYYAVSSIPTAIVDGNFKKANAGQVKAVDIDTRYGDNSAFNLTVDHTFSLNADSVYIEVTIESTADFTAGKSSSLKLRVAMLENEINLPSPALNGEQKFLNVMRKFYPNVTGTQLAQQWITGNLQTVNLRGAIPAYVFDKSEIKIVAFIQDDDTKEVQQAAVSAQKGVSVDSKLKSYNTSFMQCGSGSFQPKVTLQNAGTDDLFSVDFEVHVDNVLEANYNWGGTLAKGATTDVTLPVIAATPGVHQILILVTSPNLVSDLNRGNDTIRKAFSFALPAEAAPISEDFESGIPSKYIVENPGRNATWTSGAYSAYGQGTKSALLRFYAIGQGEEDNLYLPTLDLTGGSYARVNFDFAHALYGNGYADRCDVEASSDCGATWITLWSKSGTNLTTITGTQSAEFKPTSSQWKSDFASLDLFAGKSDVLVRFKGVSDYGNNLYLDNFNVEYTTTSNGGPTSINEAVALGFGVAPNPANDAVQFTFSNVVKRAMVNIYDANGAIQQTQVAEGVNNIRLSTSNLSSGIYFARIEVDGAAGKKSFVVTH